MCGRIDKAQRSAKFPEYWSIDSNSHLKLMRLVGGALANLDEVVKRGLPRLRGVHHQVHEGLTRDWGTQTDWHQLGELSLHLVIHVDDFHVASAEATPSRNKTANKRKTKPRENQSGDLRRQHSLPHVTFGCGVEGGQLHCAGVLWSHLKQDLLEGVELASVSIHIILVDLQQEEWTGRHMRWAHRACESVRGDEEAPHRPWAGDAPSLQIWWRPRCTVGSEPGLETRRRLRLDTQGV